MSYVPGTILTRSQPLGDALDKLRVIGESPVNTATVSDWGGATGNAMIVAPAEEFGSNEVMPIAYAQAHYSVESIPEEDYIEFDPRQHRRVQEPSPEEVFAREAKIAAAAVPIAPVDPLAVAEATEAVQKSKGRK